LVARTFIYSGCEQLPDDDLFSHCQNSKLEFEGFTCKAMGTLAQVDGKYKMTEILLEPHLVISHDKDYDRAERVLQKAEAACLITNSITAKVTMNPSIVIGGLIPEV